MVAIRHRMSAMRAAALGAVLLLGACGGGVYLGFGDGFDDSPPSVSLAAADASVAAGQSARFVAAAADESGIDHVAFYRVDPNGAQWLGNDLSAPYEWLVNAPTDGRTALSVFARATDNNGNRADSPIVTIAVTP
ncbi:MAG TPA: Ig-like domain-containing protein [Albitalea sp.]|nr:Ig-like domain-containing protein [Albitalea sp.]